MNDERRPIAWGPDEDSTLAPFVVDRWGRVFNAEKDELKTAMTRGDAAKAWNEHGRGDVWHSVDPRAEKAAGARIRGIKPDALVQPFSDDWILVVTNEPTFDTSSAPLHRVATPCTRWLFDDRSPAPTWSDPSASPPPARVRLDPPEWIPADGDIDEGWFLVKSRDDSRHLFHGPSMARRLFDDGALST